MSSGDHLQFQRSVLSVARSQSEIFVSNVAQSTFPLKRPKYRNLSLIRLKETGIYSVLIACAVFSISITLIIVVILLDETQSFFAQDGVSLSGFLTKTEWSPMLGRPPQYGIWPLVCGTLLVTSIAMAVAIPLGLITAIFLSEYAPRFVRSILKPILEILAGIPTIVYGFLALRMITPSLRDFHDLLFIGTDVKDFNIYNAFSAGLAVGVLCFPTVCSLSEDALQAVPKSLREGAFALGGTKFDVSLKVVFPGALSGIISAILLAVARAVGETMIVSMAAGSLAKMTLDPRDQVQTMTGHMVKMALGDVSYESPQYTSMYAVAFALFCMTLALTVIGSIVRRRFREAYE